MERLLLVDDDPSLRASLALGLRARGYTCQVAADLQQGLTSLATPAPFDLILLDVTLPDGNGWTLLEELRSAGDRTPVIFLTALQTPEDRVRGLRLGADDYVVKPFDFEELVARIEAVLRRHRPPVIYTIGEVRIDLSARLVGLNGQALELSQREFELLEQLILAGGQTLTRADLLARVWDIHFDSGTNVVDVVVMRVRRKLDIAGGHAIQTVVGEGYRVQAQRVKG